MKQNQQDVIIIGAGAAGIGAAIYFQKHNIRFTILEARDRIGGRLLSKKIDGVHLDLGACWIHAFTQKNPMYKYVKDMQVQTSQASLKQFQVIHIDGEQGSEFNPQIIQKSKIIVDKMFQTAYKNAVMCPQDNSVYNAAEEYIKQSIEILPQNQKRCVKLLINSTERHQGSSLRQLSVKKFDFKIDQGQNFMPDGSYAEFVKKIAEHHKLNVLFNKVVTKIAYSESSVIVTCSDGSVYYAKKLVCSLPLGVLKANKVQFQPQLPKLHQQSIGRLGVGLMNKIIVAFEQNFWGGMSWIRIGNNQRGRFFQIYNFSQNGKYILCSLMTDDFARQVQTLSNQKLLADFVDLLGQIFKVKNIKVKDYTVTHWGIDQFSLGSYASFHVGSSPQDCYRLRTSINNTIWMVGEHCYAEYIGTAHGAFKTGEWAAEQIQKSINNSQSSILPSPKL